MDITYHFNNIKNTNSTRHKSFHPPTDLNDIFVRGAELLNKEKWHNIYSEEKHLSSNHLNAEGDSDKSGFKENRGKAELSLLFKQFPKALEAVTRCSEYGHNKYKDVDQDHLNFTRVSGGSKTYADAGLRHRVKQGVDSESGLPHQYHVAWNALAELELWIKENQK